MEKKYQELFDQVHASPALRMEVLHMKERERTGRRRMPAAALIAALLVAVLAGTALAAGAMGLVHADFMDLGLLTNGEHREGLLARGGATAPVGAGPGAGHRQGGHMDL